MVIESLLLTLVLLPATTQQPAAKASIEVRVLDSATGAPLAGARLLGTPVRNMIATTDINGTFRFDGLEAGRYELLAVQPGYLGTAPQVRVVETGSRYTITFPLVRGAIVSGRIYDTNRAPVPKVEVQLLTAQYDGSGQRSLRSYDFSQPDRGIRPVQTDDRGEYRFTGLAPGEYYVRAASSAQAAKPLIGTILVRANNLASTYYPGVASADEAIPIRVPVSADLQAIDFFLLPLPPFKVSGRIANSFTERESPAYDYFLVRRDVKLHDGDGVMADHDPRGDRFEFRNVPPGAYDLYAGYLGIPSANDLILVGRALVSVVDRDVEDLKVAIEPGVDLAGEIRLDDSAAGSGPNLKPIQPLFITQDGMPKSLSPTRILARNLFVQPDGRFQIPKAAAGRYRLSVSLPAAMTGFYVSAARLGTQDILGQVFDIDSDTTGGLIIELGNPGASFTGAATEKDDKPVAGAQVWLVPSIDFQSDPMSYKSGVTDARGSFTIAGIRPGTYTAVAFSRPVDPGAVMSPEVMTRHLVHGIAVDLQKGQTVRRNVTVIPLR